MKEMESLEQDTEIMQSNEPQQAGSRHHRTSIDRGWAWVVMMATFLWNLIIAGTIKSFGVTYLLLQDLYRESPTRTAMVGATFCFCAMLASPVSGCLSDRYEVRVLTVVLSAAGGLSMAATCLAPSLPWAILFYGVLAGTLAGILDGPFLGTFSKYFRRKRSLASGIAFAGSSVGNLVIPLLLQWASEEFSHQGSLLLLGGVWMQACIVACVMRPLDPVDKMGEVLSTRRVSKSTNAVLSTTTETHVLTRPVSEDIETGVIGNSYTGIVCNVEGGATVIKHCSNDVDSKEGLYDLCRGTEISNCKGNNEILHTEKSDFSKQCLRSRSCSCMHEVSDIPANHAKEYKCLSLHDVSVNKFICSKTAKQYRGSSEKSPKESQERPDAEDTPAFSDGTIPEGKFTVTIEEPSILRDYIRFLQNAALLRVTFALLFGGFSYFNTLMFLPPYAEELRFSRMTGSQFVAMAGLTEAISRPLIGLLANHVNKALVTVMCCAAAIVACLIAWNTPTWGVLMGFTAVFGVVGGVIPALGLPLLSDTVSVENIGSAAGLFPLALGLGAAIGPPLLGFIKEVFGSYRISLHCAALCYIPALLLLSWDVPWRRVICLKNRV